MRNRKLENPVIQENQGTGPREHQPYEVPSTPGETLPDKTYKRTVNSPATMGTRKNTREQVPKGDQGARKGTNVYPSHSLIRG